MSSEGIDGKPNGGPKSRPESVPTPPNTAGKEFIQENLNALRPVLKGLALRLTKNEHDADDLVQDTWVRALTYAGSFDPNSNLEAWATTILRNIFFEKARKMNVRKETVLSPEIESQLRSLVEQEGHADIADLNRALEKIPPEQAEALVLVAGYGFSCDEAAQMIGCPSGTVKSRINRARASLAKLLGIKDVSEFVSSYNVSNSGTRKQPSV